MDQHELFQSCRRGDLSEVMNLVEQKKLELNVRDKWDNTPLYYACLCGHIEVVKYLLDNETDWLSDMPIKTLYMGMTLTVCLFWIYMLIFLGTKSKLRRHTV